MLPCLSMRRFQRDDRGTPALHGLLPAGMLGVRIPAVRVGRAGREAPCPAPGSTAIRVPAPHPATYRQFAPDAARSPCTDPAQLGAVGAGRGPRPLVCKHGVILPMTPKETRGGDLTVLSHPKGIIPAIAGIPSADDCSPLRRCRGRSSVAATPPSALCDGASAGSAGAPVPAG
jgi:hypothetical protein